MTEKTDAPPASSRPAGRPAAMASFVPDLVEHGAPVRGVPQTLDSRLFVQLQVFTGCASTGPLVNLVRNSGLEAAVYANLNDPRGVGIVLMSEDPALFAEAARGLLTGPYFRTLTPVPAFTMLGRTYSSGREADLEDFLLHRVRRHVLNPANPWGIWYPLRRIGAFNRLPRADQGRILMEHGTVGRGYGELGLALDVPPRVPRPRPRRQRVRDRPHRPRALPAVEARQGHAAHRPDLGVHPRHGPVLRRPRHLPGAGPRFRPFRRLRILTRAPGPPDGTTAGGARGSASSSRPKSTGGRRRWTASQGQRCPAAAASAKRVAGQTSMPSRERKARGPV